MRRNGAGPHHLCRGEALPRPLRRTARHTARRTTVGVGHPADTVPYRTRDAFPALRAGGSGTACPLPDADGGTDLGRVSAAPALR
jgi:hypothetical protein